VPDTTFDLGPRIDMRAAEPLVVEAFVTQRHRFLATARALSPEQWATSTRCSEWDAQELVLHVLGATNACRTTLTGERSVFGGSFDPNSSPNTFVQRRAGEPVAATLDDLDEEIVQAGAAIEVIRAQDPAPRVTAVWGEDVDWRLFVTHMFWDSWIHERDLLLPCGLEPDVVDREARLATAYGLHCAAIMVRVLGRPLDVTLSLGGPGGGIYRATADATNVRVAVAPPDGSNRVQGSAVAVTDAIAGRGPGLADVLDAPGEVVGELAQIGAFLRSPASPPEPH
jgi:uncharacterized protein (TIGR03083 family)